MLGEYQTWACAISGGGREVGCVSPTNGPDNKNEPCTQFSSEYIMYVCIYVSMHAYMYLCIKTSKDANNLKSYGIESMTKCDALQIGWNKLVLHILVHYRPSSCYSWG